MNGKIKTVLQKMRSWLQFAGKQTAKYFPFLFAVLFASYGILCIVSAGTGLSGLWIWGVLALVFAAWGLLRIRIFKLPCKHNQTEGQASSNRKKREGRKIWMKRVAYGGILVFGLYFAAVEGFVLSGMNQKESGELDYIIVLGARVTGETPGLALEKRISVAESYLKAHPDTLAVLSGGQGNDEQISEAECMRRALVAAGIEESRLILETRSTSTSENLLYSYALIPEGKKIGIVTNNFHVFRAKKIAEKLWGEHVSALSAPYPSVLLPHYLMREFFTVTLDFLRGNL